jgi:hypothetical protein
VGYGIAAVCLFVVNVRVPMPECEKDHVAPLGESVKECKFGIYLWRYEVWLQGSEVKGVGVIGVLMQSVLLILKQHSIIRL